jgi:ribonucleotide reductase alpha subunit/intein/homing endonuclease
MNVGNSAPTSNPKLPAEFDDHAVSIAKRQYYQPGDNDLAGMFERVAAWVAKPESEPDREAYKLAFFDLMASKRFCPGGRVLAGAATQHGNVLNCFVQDGRPEEEGTTDWVLNLATKLALVTKVGGGNGLCLDPLAPKRPYRGETGRLFLTIAHSHPDYQKVRDGTFMDLVHGKYVTRGYRYLAFVEYDAVPAGVEVVQVGDSVESIWGQAGAVAKRLLAGEDLLVDLSSLRAEGTPVNGSGGTSSGPSSFAVEVFDNFGYWASLGGAEYAGPIATLRYVFAPTLRAIRQGGCLHPDTLVHTSRGSLRLSELVDAHQYGWQDHHLKVATDEGWKDSPRGFNNGNAPTLRVILANGQTVQGTARHRLKVMRKDGSREWVRLEDLQAGDHVIQVLDQHTGSPVTLRPVQKPHHNAREIRQPELLTERLAFFLGYLWGDGFVSSGRVGFAVYHGSPMMEETPRLFEELFDLKVTYEQKEGDASGIFVTKAAHLIAWLEANGLMKGKARQLRLPRAVRMAPRPVLGAFLRGLFEADGTLIHGYPTLSSASEGLVQDVAVILAGLGIPTTQRAVAPRTDRLSRHAMHHVSVRSAKGLERFAERISVLPGSRLDRMLEFEPDLAKESSWVLPHAPALLGPVFAELPKGVKGRPSSYTQTRKTLSRYIRGERNLTATGYEALRQNVQVADSLPGFEFDEYYVQVRKVEDAGRSLTLDLSVDENKTYLANGVVSHNTRRGAGMATISITHPDIHDFITAKDLERERLEGDISTFNISVLVSDDFMEQARAEGEKGVLAEIAEHAWQTGEPGLIYIDRINQFNPMRAALGDIKATNPCGEIPLFPGEPCDLGAINLAAYVKRGGMGLDGFDVGTFRTDVRTCIRFLDNVLEVNHFALEDNRRMSHYLRRLGLGIMGLADALILMGYRYDSDEGRAAVTRMIDELREAATRASEELAEERGVFPGFPESDLAKARRNIALLTVAPTGTTSMLMGVSSGVEPIFAPFIYRKIGDSYAALIAPLFKELLERHEPHPDYRNGDGWDWEKVVEAVQANHGSVQGLDFIPDDVKAVLVCAHDIMPTDHVKMQGVVQRSFDGGDKRVANSISKCIAAGTLIPTSQGLIAIEDFSDNLMDDSFAKPSEELYVDGYQITEHYRAGPKPGVRITLDNGASLTGARDSHRVMTPEGWRLMSELKPGDWVLGKLVESHGPGHAPLTWESRYRTNANRLRIPERMSVALAEFLGMLAADGHTTESSGNVGLTCKNDVVEGQFIWLCRYLFDRVPRVTVDKRNGVRVLSLTSRNLARFIASLIGKGARKKQAPKEVLRGSKEEKLAFLRGVTLDGYATPQGLTVYGGTSEKLAYHVAEMLRSFGKPKVYMGTKAISGSSDLAYIVSVSNELQELVRPIEQHKRRPAVFQTYNVYVGGDVVQNTRLSTSHSGYKNVKSMRQRGVAHCEVATADRIGWETDQLIHRVRKIEDAGLVEMFDIEVADVHAYVANGIISHNTINLPNHSTKQDVYGAYTLAFDTNCKGITVYRDGSRDFQVLSTSSSKKAEKKEKESIVQTAVADEPQPVVEDPKWSAPAAVSTSLLEKHEPAPRLPGEPMFDRPVRIAGFTDKVKLTLPTGEKRGFYVTVNKQDGLPAEVFITSGKAGDESNADSEALGRVVSIALQYGVPAEAIVHTLRGINGGMYGSYQGRMVASKADLIAVALETAGVENTLNHGQGCPDCGAPLRFEEGCAKCESCGYSKCG